jgi:D-alanine transaminase
MRVAYTNGSYVPHHLATVAMEDRGHQLADGLYEVIIFFNRRFLDEGPHLARLKRSLESLQIDWPMPEAALKLVMRELIRRNPYDDGSIYMQITRGTAPRNHLFPQNTKPNLTMSVMPAKQPKPKHVEQGVPVISVPDIRWGRCDVKSISLLPNCLARQQGAEAGCPEVFLVNEQGYITEGSYSNAYLVKDGTIYTHPADNQILGGVRRGVLLKLAEQEGIPLKEEAMLLEDARYADEAFLTSANSNVLPVTSLDGQPIGTGKPGPITKQLLVAYRNHVTEQTGKTWN